MRLLPQQPSKAFKAIQALLDPGQKAYMIGENIIRICHPQTMWFSSDNELISPDQLEVKEYRIIA